jgi:hypothetical protein
MNIEDAWKKALQQTEIIRVRIQGLKTTGQTHVPYIFLSESTINLGDTVVRKGEVVVEKPSLLIPPHNPQFKGFDFEEEAGISENSMINFLLVRGISIPSLHYDNKTSSLNVFEGGLSSAIRHFESQLAQKENVRTGLITGPEDVWQFSLLIFTCSQIARNAQTDIKKLLDDFQNGKKT